MKYLYFNYSLFGHAMCFSLKHGHCDTAILKKRDLVLGGFYATLPISELKMKLK